MQPTGQSALTISYPVIDNCVLDNEINPTYFQLRNSGHFIILAEIYKMADIPLTKLKADIVSLNKDIEIFYRREANNYNFQAMPRIEVCAGIESIFNTSSMNRTLAAISNTRIANILHHDQRVIQDLTKRGTYIKKARPSETYTSWRRAFKDCLNMVPNTICLRDISIMEQVQLDPIPAQLVVNTIISDVIANPTAYNSSLTLNPDIGITNDVLEDVRNFHEIFWQGFYTQKGRMTAVEALFQPLMVDDKATCGDQNNFISFVDHGLTWSRMPQPSNFFAEMNDACLAAARRFTHEHATSILERVYAANPFAKIGFPVETIKDVNCVPTTFVELQEAV